VGGSDDPFVSDDATPALHNKPVILHNSTLPRPRMWNRFPTTDDALGCTIWHPRTTTTRREIRFPCNTDVHDTFEVSNVVAGLGSCSSPKFYFVGNFSSCRKVFSKKTKFGAKNPPCLGHLGLNWNFEHPWCLLSEIYSCSSEKWNFVPLPLV